MKWLNVKCFNRLCHLRLRPGTMLYCWPKSGWAIDVNGLKILREDPYLCWGFRNFISFLSTSFFEKFPGRVLVFSPLHPLCASMPVLPNQCSTSQSEVLRIFLWLSTFSYDLIGCLSKYHFYPNGFSKFISFLNDWKIEFRWFQVGLG